MKKNHLQVEALIRQAISACSYDEALSETKNSLSKALQSVAVVSKKRGRNAATQKALEDARLKSIEEGEKNGYKSWQTWWKMIQKNSAILPEINLEEE